MANPNRRLAVGLLLVACNLASGSSAETAHNETPLQRFGRALFFDTALSADGKVSCATCHSPDHEFADPRAVSQGAFGRTGTRNAPSLTARNSADPLMWDGRRNSLEEQVLEPLVNSVEHGLKSHDEVLSIIRAQKSYRPLLAELGVPVDGVQARHVSQALVLFIEALPRDPTPVERYLAGESGALNENQKRGLVIFRDRAKCAECHLITATQAGVSDGKYHSLGVGLNNQQDVAALARRALVSKEKQTLDGVIFADPELAALGRFLVTNVPRDIGKFRTPSLRRVGKTAPYMHNGSLASLEDAVDRELYYRSLSTGSPVNLLADEQLDLLQFLRAL